MRNNHNNLPLPNHVSQAAFLAACARIAATNGLRPIPVVNNLDIPNPNTLSVVNNNLDIPNLNVPTPDTPVVTLDNTSDIHLALLGAEQPPTE
ncbi:hypothetical protein [Candidatus Tisiphia endosymbiont of Hybos culiciformis]|uniref:hypothetical protein n=1 Tax=Candidatus Tisiphia endosymbiont of Hybos culiciformis TaxID=3139331 RepID=UPI003CCAE5EA